MIHAYVSFPLYHFCLLLVQTEFIFRFNFFFPLQKITFKGIELQVFFMVLSNGQAKESSLKFHFSI